MFLSDVKARHSGISDCRLEIADWPKERHRIVSLVETMLKLHKGLPAPRVDGGFEHKEVA
jgi:hypothetical protein